MSIVGNAVNEPHANSTLPAVVNLSALPTRLIKICRSRVGSLSIVSGTGPK